MVSPLEKRPARPERQEIKGGEKNVIPRQTVSAGTVVGLETEVPKKQDGLNGRFGATGRRVVQSGPARGG